MRSALSGLALSVVASAASAQRPARTDSAWLAYGHDQTMTRFSPLAHVTRDNVNQLAVAWTYHTGDAKDSASARAKFEATPLMIDGMLYFSTPFGRVIALDAATGKERWTFDAKVKRTGPWGDFANRGVSTWLDPLASQRPLPPTDLPRRPRRTDRRARCSDRRAL